MIVIMENQFFLDLTLDNIYKHASDEELRALVSSIILRSCEFERKKYGKISSRGFSDKELSEIAKGLRRSQ